MLDQIKELRELTGAGIMDAKKALEESDGDVTKAKEIILAKGLAKAESKSDREVRSGRVYAYQHTTGRAGALVEIACETDFVADNEEFVALCKEVAMQVVSMNPESVEDLLAQAYIRDGSKTVDQLVKELIGKTGENIRITRIARFKLGVE
jgi:elongation factor Ts